MTSDTLEKILQTEALELEHMGDAFLADPDHPLTIFAAVGGGDLVRFGKVERVDLKSDMIAAGLVGLAREDAYTVIALEAVVAVERDRPSAEREKRRTGFV